MTMPAQHRGADRFAGIIARACPMTAARAGHGLDDFQGGIRRLDAVYTFSAARPKGRRTRDAKAMGRGLNRRALALG